MPRKPTRFVLAVIALFLCALDVRVARSEFEIATVIQTPPGVTDSQVQLLTENLDRAVKLWESVILGYAQRDEKATFRLTVIPSDEGLAAATFTDFRRVDDHIVATQGELFLNFSQIENIATGLGINPGLNVLDELFIHEIGHALGVGTLWESNSVYERGTGQYKGRHGLAAYQEEFNPEATFVPVELAGDRGSSNAHWDQIFRSSPQEGNPNDPLSLSPLLGITDARGRDFAQEVMASALDPDYGEPFLSNTTVQSMRDLGYRTVEAFPFAGDIDGNGFVEIEDVDRLGQIIRENVDFPPSDLNADGNVDRSDRSRLIREILELDFGDANEDGVFDSSDLVLVSQAAEYRDPIVGNSTWRTGDWDGDAEFDTSDLLAAFATGRYEGGLPRAHSVPEPAIDWAIALLVLGIFGITRKAPAK